MNMEGETVYISKNHNETNEIDTSNFSPGVYIVKAISGNRIFYRKMVRSNL